VDPRPLVPLPLAQINLHYDYFIFLSQETMARGPRPESPSPRFQERNLLQLPPDWVIIYANWKLGGWDVGKIESMGLGLEFKL